MDPRGFGLFFFACQANNAVDKKRTSPWLSTGSTVLQRLLSCRAPGNRCPLHTLFMKASACRPWQNPACAQNRPPSTTTTTFETEVIGVDNSHACFRKPAHVQPASNPDRSALHAQCSRCQANKLVDRKRTTVRLSTGCRFAPELLSVSRAAFPGTMHRFVRGVRA